MAWAYVGTIEGEDAAAGTELDTTLTTLDVNDDDLLVAIMRWETADVSVSSIAATTTTNVFTILDRQVNTATYITMGYKIAAANDDAMVVRCTLSGNASYRGLVIMQFRPDTGETVTLDVSGPATGTGTAIASADVSTTGDDEVVVGAAGTYLSTPMTDHLIGGTADDGVNQGSCCAMWYRILDATASSISADATGPNSTWCANILGFKSATAGGGSSIAAIVASLNRKHRG